MGRHASGHRAPTLLDTLAAYWALFVAWLRLAFGLATEAGRHVAIAWPTVDPDAGATEEWAEEVHRMAVELPMRDEVRV